MEPFEFVFASESNIRHIAAGTSLAGNALAKIINNDKMELGTTSGTIRAWGLGRKNSIENFDYIQDPYFEVGFLL